LKKRRRRLDRDTTLTQQGRTGRLEKNGAVLVSQPGMTAYLQTEPQSGTYTVFNPLPDPQAMEFTVPGGVRITADAKLGMTRVSVRPGECKLWVDAALKPDQVGRGLARQLLVSGMARGPEVVLNGAPLAASAIKTVKIDGRDAWAVPLPTK